MRGSIGVLISMSCGVALAAIASTSLLSHPLSTKTGSTLGRVASHERRVTRPTRSAQAARQNPPPAIMSDLTRRLLEDAQSRASWSGGATITCDVGSILPDGAASLSPDRGPLARSAIDADYFFASVTEGRITFVAIEASGEVLVRSQDPERADVARLTWSGGVPGTTVACDSAWASATSDHFVHIRVIEEDGSPEDPSKGLTFVQGCGMFLEATATIGHYLPVEGPRCPMFVQRRHPDLPIIVTRGDVVWVDPSQAEVSQVLLVAPQAPLAWQVPDVRELIVVGDLAAYHGMGKASDLAAAVAFDLIGGRWDPIEALDLLATWSGEGLSADDPRHVHRLSRLVDDGELRLEDLKRFDGDLGDAVEHTLVSRGALVDGD